MYMHVAVTGKIDEEAILRENKASHGSRPGKRASVHVTVLSIGN